MEEKHDIMTPVFKNKEASANKLVLYRKQSITIRLGAVDQSPYTEDIRFSTGGFLYGREA